MFRICLNLALAAMPFLMPIAAISAAYGGDLDTADIAAKTLLFGVVAGSFLGRACVFLSASLGASEPVTAYLAYCLVCAVLAVLVVGLCGLAVISKRFCLKRLQAARQLLRTQHQ